MIDGAARIAFTALRFDPKRKGVQTPGITLETDERACPVPLRPFPAE